MKRHLKWVIRTVALGVLFGQLGCAQKASIEKTVQISPVSIEEARLIRLRLTSGLAIHPHEEIEFGTRFGRSPQIQRTTPLGSHIELNSVGLFSLDFSPQSAGQPLSPAGRPQTEVEKILEWMVAVRKSTLKYFETYPSDLVLFRKIGTSILDSTCFEDGSVSYCGPSVLTGALFLLGNPALETVLHEEWLPAIENARMLTGIGNQSSAVLENFVRNFDFGGFKYLTLSNRFMTEPHCRAAHERLSSADGEDYRFPEKWEISPCNLLLSSHKSRQTSPLSRGL